jgi:hypothetical protein
MDTNPFTVLTFIAAPAVLTNASSVLALGTSNRFARVIDRARELAKMLETEHSDSEMMTLWSEMLVKCELRCKLLVRGMKSFYSAVGAFAGASVLSLFGATLSFAGAEKLVQETLVLALLIGAGGLCGLIVGGVTLVRETNLALQVLAKESEIVRRRGAAAQRKIL